MPQYKGRVKGKKLTASGKYAFSGLTLNGKIGAKSVNARKIRITSAKLTLMNKGKSGLVIFKGSGVNPSRSRSNQSSLFSCASLQNNFGGVHQNSSIVSYLAYLIAAGYSGAE